MLIDRSSRLCAAIAFGVIELKRVNSEFADGTFERNAAVQGLGSVIAHNSL
jgi:hypothetical protein